MQAGRHSALYDGLDGRASFWSPYALAQVSNMAVGRGLNRQMDGFGKSNARGVCLHQLAIRCWVSRSMVIGQPGYWYLWLPVTSALRGQHSMVMVRASLSI